VFKGFKIFEVAFAIVKRMTVFMMTVLAGWCLCNFSVHPDGKLSAISVIFANGVNTKRRFYGLPVKSIKAFVIVRVDNRKKSP